MDSGARQRRDGRRYDSGGELVRGGAGGKSVTAAATEQITLILPMLRTHRRRFLFEKTAMVAAGERRAANSRQKEKGNNFASYCAVSENPQDCPRQGQHRTAQLNILEA